MARKEDERRKNGAERPGDKPKADGQAEAKPKETTVEFLSSLAAVLVTGLFIITFIVQTFVIPSASMERTLLIGDHVFVNRVQFAPKTSWIGKLLPYREVKRGEIVVFLHPAQEYEGTYVVKRIIGVPGDRIHLRNGVVYRNGEALNEPYLDRDDDRPDDVYRNNFPAVAPSDFEGLSPDWKVDLPGYIQGEDLVVPPGHYFAMGDHRGVSLDSRYWGFIPQQNVIGRPMFIYWSFKTEESTYTNAGWGDRIVSLLSTVIHFFDKTRWSRTLQVVK